MKKYVLFWTYGKSEEVEGTDIADAINRAGYGSGAVAALDFYTTVDKKDDYEWNSEEYRWINKKLQSMSNK